MLSRSCNYAKYLLLCYSYFVTALIEYLDRFNAVQDERQSVIKGLLVKMGVSWLQLHATNRAAQRN